MSTPPHTRVTQEEYLEFERRAQGKHEFIEGQIVAMAGGSPAHARIASNVLAALVSMLAKRRQCAAFGSDLRVCLTPYRLISYPDLTVVCGEPQYLDSGRDTVTNPVVTVEVLSPSTERTDRWEKAQAYRDLPSMREFLLINQTPVRIEHWIRSGEDQWSVKRVEDRSAVLRLDSIDCDLPVEQIYDDVERWI